TALDGYCSQHIALNLPSDITAKPCDVLVPPLFCFVLRSMASTSFTSHAFIHLAMVTERAIASRQMRTYEKCDGRIGYFMAVTQLSVKIIILCSFEAILVFKPPTLTCFCAFQVIFALSVALYSMHKYSFRDATFYCSAATPTTMDDVTSTSYLIVVMEAVILIMFVVVYIVNMRREKSIRGGSSANRSIPLWTRHCGCTTYAVSIKPGENLVVLRLLMPMVLLHFVIYSCFMTACAIAASIRYLFSSGSAFRAYIAAVYLVPPLPQNCAHLYTVSSPLLLWWIVKHHRKTREEQLNHMSVKPKDEKDIYFSSYAAAWNR
ncbi:hypothetical protein OSTOST_23765, partial [Ostertagia ostertagi]